MSSYEFYEKELKNILSEKRFKHSVNVARMAERLAVRYNVDPNKAKISGLLHDICKEMPEEESKKILIENGISKSKIDDFEYKVMHGFVGFFWLQENYGICDNDILNGVKYHTVGRKGMSLFEKIIFVADYISEERKWTDVKEFQKVAFENIDKVVLKKLSTAIQNCLDRHQSICENTMQLYNELILEGV